MAINCFNYCLLTCLTRHNSPQEALNHAKEHVQSHKTFYRGVSVGLMFLGMAITIDLIGYSWPKVTEVLDKDNVLTKTLGFIVEQNISIIEYFTDKSQPFFEYGMNLFSTNSSSFFTRGICYLGGLVSSTGGLAVLSVGAATCLPGLSMACFLLGGAYSLPLTPGLALISSGKYLWDATKV